MATERTILNKLIAYLRSKGIQDDHIHKQYRIPIGEGGKVVLFDVAITDHDGHVSEFYEIKTKGVTSSDVRKGNKKYDECRQHLAEMERQIKNDALGYLVTYDNRKKDFDLYLISQEIRSLADYVNVVMKVANVKSGYTNYYRGQGNIEYTLLPSLYRKTTTPNKEIELYKEAIRRSPENFAGLTSTFQQLVKLQHYGIPTRLLDLTTNALIALFFAVEDKNLKSKDAVVYVFSVNDKEVKSYDSDAVSVLSNLVRVKSIKMPAEPIETEIFNQSSDTKMLLHEIKYEKPHFLSVIDPKDLHKTICVKPKLDNARIRQQSGAFFLYGIGGSKETCSQLKEHPINIVISARSKETLMKELACFGITDAYVYPEMDHVMQNIKEEYKV